MSGRWHRKAPFVAEVAGVERLNAGFVRVRFRIDSGGEFPVDDETDRYVKIQFLPTDAPYGLPFDPKQVKKREPKHLWPRQRAFTVRDWDPSSEILSIDFVDHGDSGVVGPWLHRVQPGDRMQMRGPSGDYLPSPTGHHLLIGDECVIPAIAVTLERLGKAASADALIEARSTEHRVSLPSAAEVNEHWAYRRHIAPDEPSPLIEELRTLDIDTDTEVFLHGEASMVRDARRTLVKEKGLDPKSLSVSAYWKADRDDEAWREEKPQWKKSLKLDVS